MSFSVKSSEKRKLRVRSKLKAGNKSGRPRIVVSRSNKNIYAQLVDISGNVLHSFSSLILKEEQLKKENGVAIAKLVGEGLGKICVKAGVKEVVFDKGAYLYSGRIKALADACREAGLKF
jgi:large subunit ribosomal protein L18